MISFFEGYTAKIWKIRQQGYHELPLLRPRIKHCTVYMKLKLDYVFWHVDDGLKVVFVKVNA